MLLFSQSMQMLNIMEKMIIFENYSYLRMDGSTAIGKRQQLVQTFNQVERGGNLKIGSGTKNYGEGGVNFEIFRGQTNRR